MALYSQNIYKSMFSSHILTHVQINQYRRQNFPQICPTRAGDSKTQIHGSANRRTLLRFDGPLLTTFRVISATFLHSLFTFTSCDKGVFSFITISQLRRPIELKFSQVVYFMHNVEIIPIEKTGL